MNDFIIGVVKQKQEVTSEHSVWRVTETQGDSR